MMKLQRITVLVLAVVLILGFVPAVYGAADTVNINTASLEELTTLKGVGDAYAQRIIDYRTDKGNFAQPEDIMEVQGIGQKTYDDNKDRIVVQ